MAIANLPAATIYALPMTPTVGIRITVPAL
jgi:hypothetical protein